MALLVVAAAGIANAALAVIWRGTVEHQLTALFAPLWVGVPVGLCALVTFLLFMASKQRGLRLMSQALLVLAFFAVSLPLSARLGGYLQYRDIVAAKNYCERLVPLLEEHRRRRGSYPMRIEELQPAPPPPPRHLRHGDYYRSNGQQFDFFVVNNGSFLEYYTFDSTRREWKTWT
ncbi:MAG TPA: hypothetical protein VFV19_12675 [Candidatus Polarisedimenticolaceae bacterium]|nr:hypothetical protein [Candidatus Polarisedimenticolaceae bacterium]